MTDRFEGLRFSQEEIEEGIRFVIRDNPDRKWKDEEEVSEAVYNYLVESIVVSNIEELVKEGLIEEVEPNRFVVTKKGEEIGKQMDKEKKVKEE
jgi:hypothetical protein